MNSLHFATLTTFILSIVCQRPSDTFRKLKLKPLFFNRSVLDNVKYTKYTTLRWGRGRRWKTTTTPTATNRKPPRSYNPFAIERRLKHYLVKLYPNGFCCHLKTDYRVRMVELFAFVNKPPTNVSCLDIAAVMQEKREGVYTWPVYDVCAGNGDIISYKFMFHPEHRPGAQPFYTNWYSHKIVLHNIVSVVQ